MPRLFIADICKMLHLAKNNFLNDYNCVGDSFNMKSFDWTHVADQRTVQWEIPRSSLQKDEWRV